MNDNEIVNPKLIVNGRSIDMAEAIEKERYNHKLRSLPSRCWECHRYADDLCKLDECELKKDGRIYGW